jgi:hypothetical protein
VHVARRGKAYGVIRLLLVLTAFVLVVPGASAARAGADRPGRVSERPAVVAYAAPVAPLRVVRGFVPPTS